MEGTNRRTDVFEMTRINERIAMKQEYLPTRGSVSRRTKRARMTRVLCADDHPVMRDGLIAIIGTEPDMRVIDEAGDGREAITKYRQHQPDIVVMDLRMPNLGGVEATVQIRSEFPDARIIVLTTYEGEQDIHRALEAGAQGFLLKD